IDCCGIKAAGKSKRRGCNVSETRDRTADRYVRRETAAELLAGYEDSGRVEPARGDDQRGRDALEGAERSADAVRSGNNEPGRRECNARRGGRVSGRTKREGHRTRTAESLDEGREDRCILGDSRSE